MAFDSLNTTVPTGTDKISGRDMPDGSGFAENVVVSDGEGNQVNPATRENQAAEIALLQSLDQNPHNLRQIFRMLSLFSMALNASNELKVAQSGGTLANVTNMGTLNLVNTVSAITALNNIVAIGGVSPSMDQYYQSRAACAAINSRVL